MATENEILEEELKRLRWNIEWHTEELRKFNVLLEAWQARVVVSQCQ